MRLLTQPHIRVLAVMGFASLGVVGFQAATRSGVDTILAQLQQFYTQTRPEVSYLHLDQNAYAAGETIWFKAYLVDAQAHRLDSTSKVLYVDVVTPEKRVVFRRMLALRGGMTTGDIILPDTLQSGIYTVRAYTSWMRNTNAGFFFSRRIPIWHTYKAAYDDANTPVLSTVLTPRAKQELKVASRPTDVQFFPEGGEYVDGLQTLVGVKALDSSGHGLQLKGLVLDETNHEVAAFSTPALGMSSFSFIPSLGQKYHARVQLPDGSIADYRLPPVQAAGWSLSVRDIGANYHIFVRYRSEGGASSAAELRVVGHVRGNPVYAGAGRIVSGETYSAVLPKAKLPAGILHLTLFDGQQVARAERLLFVPEQQALQVRLQSDKGSYQSRQKVTLDVEVNTNTNEPMPAELSLTVVSATGLPAAPDDVTIQSHLLLTSDIPGYIEDPGYYFRTTDATTRRALDDLLLTQGWSRFVWKKLAANQAPGTAFTFPLEQTPTVSGRLVRPNGRPVPDGQLTLYQQHDRSVLLSTADKNGRFLFTDFLHSDTTTILLQARTSKGFPNVLLELQDLWPTPDAQWQPVPPLVPTAPSATGLKAYGKLTYRQQELERQYRPDSTSGIVLRNVTISGKKVQAVDMRSLHGNLAGFVLKTNTVLNANAYPNVFELMRGRIPGVQVTGNLPDYQVLLRGIAVISEPNGERRSSQPLFLLDGVTLSSAESLLGIPVSDIERVDVLKGPEASIYGARGANGVVAVFTKQEPDTGAPSTAFKSTAVRKIPAYYLAREFYAPRYETKAANYPDPRSTTLYWQPRVKVTTAGRAQVSFYTADQTGAFQATVQGITEDGRPILARTQFVVN